jgi:ABC-type multidrug transport system fused ATPase/permease subunit
MYQLVYVSIMVLMLLLGVTKGFSLAFRLLHGSTAMHDQMLERVMRSPVAFFDETPAGRILNRFAKDIDESKSQHCT